MPAALKAKGWSDARAFAHTQLLKNPNMCVWGLAEHRLFCSSDCCELLARYFYRHVEPTEAQVSA